MIDIHVESNFGNLEALKEAISQGISVDTVDSVRLETPLFKAICKCDVRFDKVVATSKDHFECAKFLLENGANPNHKDKWGQTPLCFASKNTDATSLLLSYGADVNPDVPFHAHPLYSATYNPECVKLLAEAGANVHLKSEENLNFLLASCRFSQFESAKVFFEYGVNILEKDNIQWNALHSTVEFGEDVEFIRFLVGNGVSIHDKDIYGQTPLMLAARNGRYKSVKELLSLGADKEIKDNYGRTALDQMLDSEREIKRAKRTKQMEKIKELLTT